MPYIPTYTGADFGPMATDIVGKGLATGVALAPVIALGLGYKYLKASKAKKKAWRTKLGLKK